MFQGACLPYVDLEPWLDLSALPGVHEEVCLGLTTVPIDYTGGSHRSMGIMPASRAHEALQDYGEVIRGLSAVDFETFRGLAEAPRALDVSKRAELTFGEERDVPLSRRQMLWLKFRHGVYFPWKVYVELIPNRLWGEKSTAAGKDFTRLAKTFFPKTLAFVKSLPFEQIGRCNVMGLEAHDYGTLHRDGEPEDQGAREVPDHFITICPANNKRLYLWDETTGEKSFVRGRAYWFNDGDYHGVEADPFFRYSIRIDGLFHSEFLEKLRASSMRSSR